jgi:hypothetical protein
MMSSPDGHIGGNGDPLIGQVFLDRYRIVRELEGRSGARLYLAQHVHDDRPVDVQILDAGGPRAEAVDPAVDRFLEHARIIARVGHENIIEIFNGGRSPQGAPFLAIEHVEGTDLRQVLAQDGPLLWDRAQGIVGQVAAALGAVHHHGVVHGDLRPETVRLVPRAGRRDFVKLLDFGVARAREATPASPRDDVYALGGLVYQLVTGRPPFPSREGDAPPAPSTLRPAGTLPADLDAVMLRALDKDPDQRWLDMASFSDAIARCRLTRRQSVRVEALSIAEHSGKTGAFEADARKRRRFWAVSSVVAAVVIAIAVLRVLTTTPGHVQISTMPADADLTFNGIPVAARSPVVLDAAAGRYTLVVARAGYVTAQRTVDVTAGVTVSVPVELVAVPAAPVLQPTPATPATPEAATAPAP